ncbi:DUF6949 family protein [Propylenella binzhouense]|uniref:Uncharacterized protein n=1 Tax=Propylenella binzhouense TaxID=2555902 RepID=A0A964T5H5_9HYPH|nr:hypothetical protein [Propylenella binzhouense]MYZ47832.1 hypothetical protein [Propylenella binzhouense]
MPDLQVFVFCMAMGFALAGAVSSFYQLVTSEPANFRIGANSVFGNLTAVVISIFGGPFIVARLVLRGLRTREMSVAPVLVGLVVSAMWSTCAGIFFLSVLLSA